MNIILTTHLDLSFHGGFPHRLFLEHAFPLLVVKLLHFVLLYNTDHIDSFFVQCTAPEIIRLKANGMG